MKVLKKVGMYKVGDKYKAGTGVEYEVTGLGEAFTKKIRDEDACCYGLMPGSDHSVTMQYVYLK